ncbi:glutamate 5-kinase [Actinomyces sp. zg-332]|uniref:glutamate 5-kinase n=1 Tax=Actinomyces sp. zg-332 TaxID=2708340 RepID=UPI00142282E2|nr:glutamate 5-kinase [Actinomyces sp. zg-332]QPK94458.1 glutamate 5-kinase [Actinomyces sp. zg-332]
MAISTRSEIPTAKRIVVKLGSSSLTYPTGGLNHERIHHIAKLLSDCVKSGQQVAIVSSGAIAAGMTPLQMNSKPTDLPLAQATSAVGQSILMAAWGEAFSKHNQQIAQVLISAGDMNRRKHYRNAHQALECLFSMNVIPIVNENDMVATHEIRFGDNDRLASIVSHFVMADALILLTDVDGLYDRPPKEEGAEIIPCINGPEDIEGILVSGSGSKYGTGGMVTKLRSATIASVSGIPVLMTSAENIDKAIAGKDVGTWFNACGERPGTRSLWLAYAAIPKGVLVLDEGAVKAVTEGKHSLLATGIVGVIGDFLCRDVVELVDNKGQPVARGFVSYDSDELPLICGKNSEEMIKAGIRVPKPVVHRDDLAEIKYLI